MGDVAALHSFVYQEPQVIAEIGCNHKGEIECAKELLTLCKKSGATVGKFQKRTPKELLTPEQYNAPHPNPQNSYGSTYGEHREFLELSVDDQWVERHFTKDRTWKGTDHAASLEPEGLRRLCRDLKAMHTALTYKKEDILDLEKGMSA